MKAKQMATPLNIYSVLRTVDYYGPASAESLARAAACRLDGTREPSKNTCKFCSLCIQALHMQGFLRSDRYGIQVSDDGVEYVKRVKEEVRWTGNKKQQMRQ
jgi:ribosomal protein S19E (S16A)